MRPRNLIIGVLAGFALAAGVWVAVSMTAVKPESVWSATILPSKVPIPAFNLRTHTGEAADQSVFKGQWDLVFFGFTHCPDICPLTLKVLENARTTLKDKGEVPLPRIVLVSVDPERDTPEHLAAYIGAFGETNLGLTGELEELRKLTGSIGIFFEKREIDDEQYTVDHSSVVVVIDPDGRFHSLFSSPHRVENYVHDLPLLIGS